MNKYLKIIKILNNNAVVCLDKNDEEKIVMGRGIAFQKKTGSQVDYNNVEKEFSLSNSETSNHFQKIIQEIPSEYILLAEKIISHAKSICKRELYDSIYITLTDHINTALQRQAQNIELKNPLLHSIKRLYPEEYKLSLDALGFIKEATGVSFPDDEAAFITMHFINAELGPHNKNINTIVYATEEIAKIIEKYIDKDIDEESITWQRFVTHISFMIQRLLQGKDYSDKGKTLIFDMLKETYPNAYKCAILIKNFLESKFECIIGNEELSYLIIHISKLQNEYGVRNPDK